MDMHTVTTLRRGGVDNKAHSRLKISFRALDSLLEEFKLVLPPSLLTCHLLLLQTHNLFFTCPLCFMLDVVAAPVLSSDSQPFNKLLMVPPPSYSWLVLFIHLPVVHPLQMLWCMGAHKILRTRDRWIVVGVTVPPLIPTWFVESMLPPLFLPNQEVLIPSYVGRVRL